MDYHEQFDLLLTSADSSAVFAAQADFFRLFYAHPEMRNVPFVNAFLIVSGWLGTSFRSGVWTFYEATPQQDTAQAVRYLNASGAAALAEMLQKGNHDYQDPQYQEDFDYPEEWITESEEIDRWIAAHEQEIMQHLTDELLAHRQQITEWL